MSIPFMYFRGENTSLNLVFIPIGYVRCSYIVRCIASPWFGLLLPRYTQYPYSLLFGADPLFTIFCRCALEYLVLLSFSILCLENVLNCFLVCFCTSFN